MNERNRRATRSRTSGTSSAPSGLQRVVIVTFQATTSPLSARRQLFDVVRPTLARDSTQDSGGIFAFSGSPVVERLLADWHRLGRAHDAGLQELAETRQGRLVQATEYGTRSAVTVVVQSATQMAKADG